MTDAGRPAVPGDEQELRGQIERTREQLGQTVEQLAAKADVASTAKAKAAEVIRRAVIIAKEHQMPLTVAVGAVLAGCLGLLWWKKR